MIKSPKQYQFNPDPIKQQCKEFIVNHHYAGSCPPTVKCFALEDNEVLIGVCIFSNVSRQSIKVPNCNKLLELSRLFILDGTPKNTESYFIGKCLKWLKKNTDYEAIVSFADPTQGHQGTIYKATNFILLGKTAPNYHYMTEFGQRIHKKQVWDRAKLNGHVESVQSKLELLTKVPELSKFKYVYYLKNLAIKSPNIIYGLIDPFTDELRYIGKSVSGLNRPNEHFKPYNLKEDTHKVRWVKSVLAKNHKPKIIVIEEHKYPTDLDDAESFWIEYYKGIGARLTNSTNGGVGSLGRICKDETKLKISQKATERQKGQPVREGMKVPKAHQILNNKEYRECTKCEVFQLLDQFNWIEKTQRWYPYCKSCKRTMTAERRKVQPPKKLSPEEWKASYQNRQKKS